MSSLFDPSPRRRPRSAVGAATLRLFSALAPDCCCILASSCITTSAQYHNSCFYLASVIIRDHHDQFSATGKPVPDLNEVAFSTHTRTNLGEDVWYRAKALWQFRDWSLNTQDPDGAANWDFWVVFSLRCPSPPYVCGFGKLEMLNPIWPRPENLRTGLDLNLPVPL